MNQTYYILLPDQPAFLLDDEGLPKKFTSYDTAEEYAHYNLAEEYRIWAK